MQRKPPRVSTTGMEDSALAMAVQSVEINAANALPVSGGLVVGIDVGGTKIMSGLSDTSGRILRHTTLPTEAQQGRDVVIERIERVAREVMSGVDHSRIIGVGIGAPGPIDPFSGTLYSPPNLLDMDGVPLREIMRQRLGLPVYLANDANAAAVGEYLFGVREQVRNMIYITISTGVGGGIIIDGKLFVGARGMGGEVGHMTIEAEGPRCNCGNIGCLEVLASGTAIARYGAALVAEGRAPILSELAKQRSAYVTARLVQEAAERGERESQAIIARVGFYMGVGIVNLLHLFNPQLVIIGGGVSHLGALLFDPIRRTVAERAIPAIADGVEILPAHLGDQVGLLGAIAIVLHEQAIAASEVRAA
jgi:glucokinase